MIPVFTRNSPVHEGGNQPGSDVPCFLCGACCTQRVPLTLVEAHLIADGLGIEWNEFRSYHLEDTRDQWQFYLRQEGSACVFLSFDSAKSTKCMIYEFRPISCREWMPSLYRHRCQTGLRAYWHLKVSSSGLLLGTKENLNRFRHFLAAQETIEDAYTYPDWPLSDSTTSKF